MKKSFKLSNLDCANCAAKMEREIAKIQGVNEVRVNFMAQKLTLAASDEAFDGILDQAKACIRKVEPGCAVG